MDGSVEEKQLYLRSEILQSGYDPEQFVSFVCADQKVQSIQMQNWSFEFLKSIVLKFKQYKYYSVEQKQMVVSQEKMKEIGAKKSKIKYDNWQDLFDYQFTSVCKCIQAQPLVKNNNLQIRVIKVLSKDIEGLIFNIGSKTQVWFIIQSNFVKDTARRELNDIEWLSNTVSRLLPISAVPQLPKQFMKDMSEQALQKKRKEVEEYLQILASRPELKRAHLLLDFITVHHDKMEKLKKTYDSMGFAKGISAIKNEGGQVQINYTNKIRQFQNGCAEYSKKVNPIHQNLSESFKKVADLFNATSIQINKIVDYYADIHEAYIQLMNKFPNFKNNEYSQTLININNLFHNLSDSMQNNSKILTNHLKDYYKLSINYDRSISKQIKSISQTQRQYLSYKNNLFKKKDRIFPDTSKWEISKISIDYIQNKKLTKQQAFDQMLPRQTLQQNQLRLWLAFLYDNFANEFQNYIAFSNKRYQSRMVNFASDMTTNNKNFIKHLQKYIEDSRIK